MICNICGHSRTEHLKNETDRPGKHFCDVCADIYLRTSDRPESPENLWHDFEDNLDYIEKLAKQKGLV